MSATNRYQLLTIAVGMSVVGLLVARFASSLLEKMAREAARASGYGQNQTPFAPMVTFARFMFPAFGLFACVSGFALAIFTALGFWGVGPFR